MSLLRLVIVAKTVLDLGAAIGFCFSDKRMALMFAGFTVADIACAWSTP